MPSASQINDLLWFDPTVEDVGWTEAEAAPDTAENRFPAYLDGNGPAEAAISKEHGGEPEGISGLASVMAERGFEPVTGPVANLTAEQRATSAATFAPPAFSSAQHAPSGAPDNWVPDAFASGSAAANGNGGNSGPQAVPDLPAENGDLSASIAVAATGNALIDGVLIGSRWNETYITYSDTDSAGDYQSGYVSDQDGDGTSAQNEGFSQLTAAQMVAMHSALNQAVYTQLSGATAFSIEAFTNISIDYQGAGASNSTIRAANSSDAGTAYAFYPASSIYGGDAFFGNTYDGTSNSLKNPVAGNYAWHTMFHELGHSMGLKHGQELGGPGNTAVPADYNSVEFTVMTYSSYIGDVTSGYDYEQWGAPQTYMMLDIQALQYMYGADFTVNSGNTVYTWDPNSGSTFIDGVLAIDPGGNRIFATIWDGDGVDTYDLSNYTTNLSLDLRPGEHSTFSAAQLAYLGGGPNNGYARGNIFNALQYNGDTRSLIENANGGSGSDTITGNDTANVLNGNDGNDTIDGNGGVDSVNGGAGNDTFLMDSGDGIDNFNGGTGFDTINFSGLGSNLVVVDLGAGTWDFQGGGGTLGAAIAIESLIGTSGDDTFLGDASGNGFDGRDGNDTMDGGAGNDSIHGGNGNDRIQGGDGNDGLLGDAGDDIIQGGAGDDSMTGGSGADLLYGNDGNDRFYIETGWTGGPGEAIFGGAGIDTFDTSTVIFSGFNVTINLDDGTFSYSPAGSGDFSLSSIENAITGDGDDSVTGTYGDNRLTTGAGTDILIGLGGKDVLIGGAGVDSMDGGGGDDLIYVDDSGDTVAEAVGGGYDRVLTSTSYTLSTGAEVELFTTTDTAGAGALNLTGNEFAQTIDGNAGANIIDGKGGADTMYGFGGNDWYYVDNVLDRVIETAGGGTQDRVLSSVNYALAAGTDIETLTTTLTAGTGAIDLTGNEFVQLIGGNNGANVIDGKGGADTMQGFGGNDTYYVDNTLDKVIEAAAGGADRVLASVSYSLAAGVQVETLTTTLTTGTNAIALTGNEFAQLIGGNNGANYLDGKGGVDTIYGFGGNDSFAFTSALGPANADTIADFSVADDTMILAHAVFTGLGAGQVLAAAAFVIGYGAANANQHIIYNPTSGNLYFDDDGNGADLPQQFAHLSAGLTTMTNADFYVA